MSYSQFGQEVEVIKFYKNKPFGFFVEIGAHNGKKLSNTYMLESQFKWKGICVEPNPQKYELLCKNRRRSFCCDRAVYSESNKELIFDIANNDDLLSGISETIDFHKNFVDTNKSQILVNTISFFDLLEKYNAPSFIEYLSLDTEGSEYEILKSLDFQKYIFGLIHVEHNFVEPKRSQINELLTSNGYEFIKENHIDDVYKHKTID
jgi:FkbM family methyltransferase